MPGSLMPGIAGLPVLPVVSSLPSVDSATPAFAILSFNNFLVTFLAAVTKYPTKAV